MPIDPMNQIVVILPSGRFEVRVVALFGGSENQVNINTGFCYIQKERIAQSGNCADSIAAMRILPRLRGGSMRMSAAEKIKLEEAKSARDEISRQNYKMWFDHADCTQDGRSNARTMKLLCVSNVLMEEKESIHGPPAQWGANTANTTHKGRVHFQGDDESPFCSEPRPDAYGLDDCQTGWEHHEAYNKLFGQLVKDFFKVFSTLQYCPEYHDEPGEVPLIWILPASQKGAKQQQPSAVAAVKFAKLVLSEGFDGLWYKGPKQIVLYHVASDAGKVDSASAGDSDKLIWDLHSLLKSPKYKALWCAERQCFKPPWRVDGEYADIERWMHEGVGTTTYLRIQKEQAESKDSAAREVEQMYIRWSQEDLSGPMSLTDRERLRLKQRFQLFTKQRRVHLSKEELELSKELGHFIVPGPCHSTGIDGSESHRGCEGAKVEILQWRVRPLRQQLFSTCVFWTNTKVDLPGGSVADRQRCPSLDPPRASRGKLETLKGASAKVLETPGRGLESIEFFKYEEKIGALRKRYILEDRQRLLDTIEGFTPDYEGLIKYAGLPAGEDGKGDHLMGKDLQQTIVNAVALALDMNMPDHPEDKLACYIKRLVELNLGPTWHVIVGRSFGYQVQCDARHLLHLYMRHLSILIWKSEPSKHHH